MSLDAIWGEAWRYYTTHFWRFVGMAASVFVFLDLFSALAGAFRSSHWFVWLIWALASIAVWVVGTFWVEGAVVEAVSDIRAGRRSTPGKSFERVRPQLGSLVVAGILAGVGVAVGFVLLVVPGLYLLTRWSMLVPSIQLEKLPAGKAFSRSAELVRGHGLRVFGAVLATYLVVVVVGAVLEGIFSLVLPSFLDTWLGGLVANSVTVPFLSIVLTVIYFRLVAAETGAVEPAGATA